MRVFLSRIILVILLASLPACTSKQADTGSSNSASNTVANNPPQSNAQTQPAPEPPAPEPPPPIVIPAGTKFTVKLSQDVGSKISETGQTFSATLSRPIEIEGKEVIPAGAAVTGKVVDAKPLGRLAGEARLSLRLTSITVNGQKDSIKTRSIVRTEKGKGKRTGVLAGGGAGLGALIGGLAGGGKGAVIGGVSGAGAGTAGSALTGNHEIVLPAEHALTFTLSQSLQLQ